ncbi:hypothetical protein S40285_06092 [Stachybotrys chlorohalonatus IBT 40285]|uniref:Carbohydrate esterase 2 N-terminal domain-containing protein n=1 Tax=Stachybotrys chlorohalonatus (strain IBT 40285) TaxID=1283841 RepID=A0A084QEQ2_STAC4|nr:hypothetical protein S40285_06092 [Stachybotrys chlorohalonata IBT 40285]
MRLFALSFLASAAAAAAVSGIQARNETENFRFVGRVNPETRELTWPSTGVAFSFTGTTASVLIDSFWGAASVNIYIDGNPEAVVVPSVSAPSIDIPTLPQGYHTVEVRKRSETYFGTFRVTDVVTDGVFGFPVVPERKIEVIGDSISVGYGLDGDLPCTDSATLQNNGLTYGAVAARALDADYSVVAWSGKGLIRNYAQSPPDPEPPMPVVYTRYGALDPNGSFTFPSSWVPDAVVINLGTNDFSYLGVRDPVDPADLVNAFVDLIRLIHSNYPAAVFFLVSSPMLSDSYPSAEDAQKSTHAQAIRDTIRRLCNLEIHFVDWPAQGAEVACDYHPTAETQAIGAGLLVDSISDALGWAPVA